VKEFEEQHSKRIEELLSLYKEVPVSTAKVLEPTPKPPSVKTPTMETIPRLTTTVIEPVSIQNHTTNQPLQNLSSNTQNTTPSSPQPRILSSSENTIPRNPATAGDNLKSNSLAVFNASLPFPSVPETPNTLVGMVFGKTGNIIENAVVEIKNQGGTVRATKTNRLGQFFLATPLNSDSYSLYTEKEKFAFNPISLKLEGKIYPPLEIRATN
jgi:hypothetical protein